ncbi:MAG: hypothetical protein JWM78_3528 [Verrucomicrobiaceae bacterium]|nr:hypothetical protein [Verrucomicrobiaceae bacterium]
MGAWLHSSLPALTEQQFVAWQQLIETRTGIDFSQHLPILQGGLFRRLRELEHVDVDAYFKQVSKQPEGLHEWQRLLAHIAVKETSFFRQPAAFELVRKYLRKRVTQTQTLDVWSVGCATGEEPYSLAMIASDVIEHSETQPFLGVLATDMCTEALQLARGGCYREKRLEQVPASFRRRFFTLDSEQWYRIKPELHQRICFAQANLLEVDRLPALPMDVIFCQNVLVYFRRGRTKQVLDALVARLKPGGLLVLGPGEAAHWQHPAVTRTAHQGVSAWLHRAENPVPQPISEGRKV